MKIQKVRQEVLDTALEMSRCQLARGTAGNVSARDPETGLIAITPSGIPYEELTVEDISVVDLSGTLIEGKKPSSETPMHTGIFRDRPDVFGIVHTHSIYATTITLIGHEIPAVTVPLSGLAPVKILPFKLPGSQELADEAVKLLGKDGKAILLANHGVLCVAPTVKKALSSAVYVEEGAQVALFALIAGKIQTIPEEFVVSMKQRLSKGKAI